MELPIELRGLIENAAHDIPQNRLIAISDSLSQRYRTESGTGKSLLSSDAEAIVYSIARMPATYGAVCAALENAIAPNDEYASLLDVGAGTGAASWACAMMLNGLKQLTCVERETAMLRLGEGFMRQSEAFSGIDINWICADARAFIPEKKYDVIIASYMLNEFSQGDRAALLDRLWRATGKLLLIIEPGTPVGFELLRAARSGLISSGAHVIAPCPHEGDCPLTGEDWCHFTCRIARSKLHKALKGGSAPYEDEKFAYMAFAPEKRDTYVSRVRRHPIIESGRITLELCTAEGICRRVVTKKDGALFKVARKVDCGDGFGAK